MWGLECKSFSSASRSQDCAALEEYSNRQLLTWQSMFAVANDYWYRTNTADIQTIKERNVTMDQSGMVNSSLENVEDKLPPRSRRRHFGKRIKETTDGNTLEQPLDLTFQRDSSGNKKRKLDNRYQTLTHNSDIVTDNEPLDLTVKSANKTQKQMSELRKEDSQRFMLALGLKDKSSL